ncbi:MAG: hypothetical protein EXS40_02700 [Opitutaceae bacterium]|nr:hypothetical protein [Opitutaceae bacterium]
MRRDGINQNLGLFAVGTRENPPVTISSRPAAGPEIIESQDDRKTEADSAFFVLSHRIVGRVADGLDAVADV